MCSLKCAAKDYAKITDTGEELERRVSLSAEGNVEVRQLLAGAKPYGLLLVGFSVNRLEDIQTCRSRDMASMRPVRAS